MREQAEQVDTTENAPANLLSADAETVAGKMPDIDNVPPSSSRGAVRKPFLTDVAVMRLSLIALLIVYHALAIHTGGWRPPYASFEAIPLYDWLGMLTHCPQLEAMVFISGLLLGFKAAGSPSSLTFRTCVSRKAKRILLPCLIFGVAYYALFFDLSASPWDIAAKILNGCGHLWFLPMLFWCFVLTYVITSKLPPPVYNKVLICACIWVVFNPLGRLPFGLGSLGNYFLFFYAGFLVKQGLVRLPSFSRRNMLAALALFAAAFVAYMWMRGGWPQPAGYPLKLSRHLCVGVARLSAASAAVYLMYGWANRPGVSTFLASRPALITLGGYCYGVYIYQQFVLQVLYYKTPLPLSVGAWLLPWVASAITLAASLLLCHLTLRTRFGRFLIG